MAEEKIVFYEVLYLGIIAKRVKEV